MFWFEKKSLLVNSDEVMWSSQVNQTNNNKNIN